MASPPRNLLDLPIEILCIIIRYCCQGELDGLLWSCPLVTAEGQDGYRCTVCHGSINASSKNYRQLPRAIFYSESTNIMQNARLNSGSSSNSNRNSMDSNRLEPYPFSNNSKSSDTVLREKRRRIIAAESQGAPASSSSSFVGLHLHMFLRSKTSASISLQNGYQRCDHKRPHPLQQLQGISGSTRSPYPAHSLLTSTPLLPITPSFAPRHEPQSLQPVCPPTEICPESALADNTLAAQATTETASTASTTSSLSLPLPQEQAIHASVLSIQREQAGFNHPLPDLRNARATILSTTATTATSSSSSCPSHAQGQQRRSMRIKKSMKMKTAVSAAASSSSCAQTINSQPLPLPLLPVSTSRKIVTMPGTPEPGQWSGVQGKADINIVAVPGSAIEPSDSKAQIFQQETRYTDTLLLAPPFHLALVNKLLADLVVPMLWSSVVFHGHDTIQIQSILASLGHTDISSSANSRRYPSRNAFQSRRLNKSLHVPGNLSYASPLSSTKCTYATSRWSYSSFVKRVVLDFAHPQASPQMLLQVLECIGSRCDGSQIRALDLHANEKMRATELGLDTATELDRLFGTGSFSGLRYLRLQGGFVDSQLLGALIKGLDTSPLEGSGQPCRLSHVFLGPGSVTDSAIEKLVAAAGHCLEVFTVTSCVDVGGKSLASLLTKCPKLRVLGVHKSLASDKELLEGLGIDVTNHHSVPSSISNNSTVQQSTKRKTIIAPLERLELGTVKLTTVGVTEIVKGTCQSLRYLYLGSRHFKEEFLKGVVLPMCERLVGLCFDDPDCSAKQQQQPVRPDHTRDSAPSQQPGRRLFELGHVQRWLRADHTRQSQRYPGCRHQSYQQRSELHFLQSHQRKHPYESHGFVHSPWLGDSSTEQWILHGDCISWAANSTSTLSIMDSFENGGGGMTSGSNSRYSSSANQSRPRVTLSALVRGISSRLSSLFVTRNRTFVSNSISATPGASEGAATSSDRSTATPIIEDQDTLLERFHVSQETIDVIQRALQSSLKSFTVMRMDMVSKDSVSQSTTTSTIVTTACKRIEAAPPVDQLEVFLRLVVILGVLVLGTAHTVAQA